MDIESCADVSTGMVLTCFYIKSVESKMKGEAKPL